MNCKYKLFSKKAFNIFASMKILIVSATEQEIKGLTHSNIDFLVTGIGIPNSIFNLTAYLHDHKYDLIINIGICGSFKKDYKIGDVVEVIRDEFSEIGYEDDQIFRRFESKFKIPISFTVKKRSSLRSVNGITVNTVHGNHISIQKIVNDLNPDIESMEGAACMMVAEKLDVKFMQIRSVSNYVETRNKDNWNLDLAIKNLHKELYNILSIL